MIRWVAGALVILSALQAGAARDPLLVAEYEPGLSKRCGWKTVIESDGTVTRFVEPAKRSGQCDMWAWPRPKPRRIRGTVQLSAVQLSELERAISEAGLAILPFHATPGID